MGIITRKSKGSKLTTTEMDNNLKYLDKGINTALSNEEILLTSLSSEKINRINSEVSLSTQLITHLSLEIGQRISCDVSLSSEIYSLITEISDRINNNSNLITEISDRILADSVLSTEIINLSTEIYNRTPDNSNLITEISDRILADSVLSTEITLLSVDIVKLSSDIVNNSILTSEISERILADSVLSTEITLLSVDINNRLSTDMSITSIISSISTDILSQKNTSNYLSTSIITSNSNINNLITSLSESLNNDKTNINILSTDVSNNNSSLNTKAALLSTNINILSTDVSSDISVLSTNIMTTINGLNKITDTSEDGFFICDKSGYTVMEVNASEFNAINGGVDSSLYYSKTEVDTLIDNSRIDLNLTTEQIASLNVNLTPINNTLSEINIFSLKGKSAIFLGDSLTSANGGTMETIKVGSWPAYVKSNLQLSSNSRVIAQGGATTCDSTDTSLVLNHSLLTGSNNTLSNQVYQLVNYYKLNYGTSKAFSPDMIYIMIGSNDILTSYPMSSTWWNAKKGDWATVIYGTTLSDADYDVLDLTDTADLARYTNLRTIRKTIYGAWKWTLETLIYWFPNAHIYLCTSLGQGSERGKNIADELWPVQEKIAYYYGINLIDTGRGSGYSRFANLGVGYSNSYYSYDGVHPSTTGKILVGNYVAQQVKSKYFTKPNIPETQVSTFGFKITVVSVNDNETYGTLSPSGITYVLSGNSFTLTITPASGHSISTIMDNSVSQTITTNYVLTNISQNHEIYVTFI